MLAKVGSRLSFANVVSVLALFLALTGGAVALQGKNSVDSGDIQKNGVKSPDIAANTVKGKDANEATFGQVPGQRRQRGHLRPGPVGGERGQRDECAERDERPVG